jgi:serine/threonine protein kinase
MLGRAGMAPPAIFDLVGEMSLASKEQLILDNGRQSGSTSQLPPPPPRPSILDGYADRSLRATLVGKGDGSGVNPTSEARSTFQDRETLLQTYEDAGLENRSNIDDSVDLSTRYRDPRGDAVKVYEETAGNKSANYDLGDSSSDSSLSRSLSRRPTLQEPQPLPGKTIKLEIQAIDSISNAKSKIQNNAGVSSDQHSVVAEKELEYKHAFEKLLEQPLKHTATTAQVELAEQGLQDRNLQNVFGDLAQTEPLVFMTQINPNQPLDLSGHTPEIVSSTAMNWLDANAVAIKCIQTLPTFLSVKLLGTGGFSTVDEVVHRETNLRVSRKTLKNRELSAMQELRKEVNVLQKLRHPHIIRFLGAYSKGDKMSILLSPVAETTLAVWLDKSLIEKPSGLADTIVNMFGCLVSSIRYLHEQRPIVKHMDIKPQNILVMHGNQEFPHIILNDFGVSSSEERTHPDRRTKPLTRQYCAPEVPSGLAREQAADIWSLGCVLVEMATTAFNETNSQYLEFRKEFNGSEGNCYWQNIPRLHEWLSGFQEQASTPMEATVVLAVASMLNGEPTDRPDAATLSTIFTPAPCCLGWADEKASFPSPQEELTAVEKLFRDDSIDCRVQRHLCGANHDPKPEPFARAKNWLEECSLGHEACHGSTLEADLLPTRLVDLQPKGTEDSLKSAIRIVNSIDIEPANYAVISYAWGSSDLTLSSSRMHEMQSALTRDKLSAALNEAMTAADNIGYRYIWVESLCIVQDSHSDKLQECPAMAKVYRNAALTIVAHSTLATTSVSSCSAVLPKGSNGKSEGGNTRGAPLSSNSLSTNTSGSSTTSMPTHLDTLRNQDFATDTRSWSLQDRLLSRRLLHLAGEQMYWECNTLKASETFPQGLSPLLWEKVHTKPTSTSSTLESKLMKTATSSSRSIPSDMQRRPTINPRLLKNCQYIRKQGGAFGDSMTAQGGLKVHTGGRGRVSILRSGQFQTSRKRYNESRSPLQGNGDVGNIFADADRGFKFDFELNVHKGTVEDSSGDRKTYVEGDKMDAK